MRGTHHSTAVVTDRAAAPVPFFALAEDWRASERACREAIAEVLASGRYVLGACGARLERALATYLGAAHVLGTASGTDALVLALRAAGIGRGDDVVVPAFSFVASASAVLLVGANPVFADVVPGEWTLDPDDVARVATPTTRAIIGVDLYGLPADWPALRRVAASLGAVMVEDAAQAFGARVARSAAGTLADYGCLSFYPTKILGAAGDAGAIVVSDAAAADAVRALRNHGASTRMHHDRLGLNSRLDEVQAAVLGARLPYVDAHVTRRRAIAARYSAGLAAFRLGLPAEPDARTHAWNLYTVDCRSETRRDALAAGLRARGIGCDVYYPKPVHRQPLFAYRGAPLPVSEGAARTLLSLPIYPSLDDASVDASSRRSRSCRERSRVARRRASGPRAARPCLARRRPSPRARAHRRIRARRAIPTASVRGAARCGRRRAGCGVSALFRPRALRRAAAP